MFVALLIQTLAINVFYRYKLDLNVNSFVLEIIKSSLIMVCCLSVGLIAQKYFEINNWIELAFFIGSWGLLVVCLNWIFVLNSGEKIFVKGMLRF